MRNAFGRACAATIGGTALSWVVATSPGSGQTPELYGTGVFSTAAWDFFMAWSPDQRDVLFCRAADDFESFEIWETRRGPGGAWTTPAHPRFAAKWSNSDPHVTVDGRRVLFISNRPLPPTDTGTAPRPTYDIWYAELEADGSWGDARHLDAVLNDPDGNEWSPAIAANGNIYFGSNRPAGGRGDQDLWVSRLVHGVYQPAENLGDSVNTAGGEIEPWIAPDESYLIFSAARRADSVGTYDLYIAERRNGTWQRARPLPLGINTAAWELNPSVSPDGRWLYFSSTRPLEGPGRTAQTRGIGDGKHGDIYRVPMALVRRP